MRKFLFRLCLFVIPALILLMAAELFMRSLPNTYKYKDEWMKANAHSVSTLLLGNSHGYFALRPSIIGDSTFSLCNVSQRLEHDFFLLKKYSALCPNLRRVVVVADNSNLFDVPMEEEEPYRVTYYQLYMGYDAHPQLSEYAFELANTPSAIQKIKSFIAGGGITCDSLGWGRNYRAEDRDPRNFLPENVREHRFVNWQYTMRNRCYMDSIAYWCQKKNIDLFFIQTPVSSAYTQKANPRQLRLVNHMVDSCCNAYGACHFNFSCDERFSDSDFYDTDHLTDIGASNFSKLLRQSIDSLSH